MATDWAKLFDEHGPALLLYARQWTESAADAEEAVQDGFVKFWTSRFRDAPDPLPLLYVAVRQCALDRRRSRQRRVQREKEAERDRHEQVAWFECPLEAKERCQAVQDALQSLPDEQREVLVMKIWGGLTFKQIGEALGIPLNTAASRYRYALAGLRQRLMQQASV